MFDLSDMTMEDYKNTQEEFAKLEELLDFCGFKFADYHYTTGPLMVKHSFCVIVSKRLSEPVDEFNTKEDDIFHIPMTVNDAISFLNGCKLGMKLAENKDDDLKGK